MSKIYRIIIPVIIIAVFALGFIKFKNNNEAILANQQKGIEIIERELLTNINQINQDLNNELITEKKAQERFQAEYEKYKTKNSELYNETLEKMKIQNIFK